MKKSILLFGCLIVIMVLSAQSYATFRLGSTDASTLSPGDQVYVPVYCDDITPECIISSAQFFIGYDHSVLSWTGEVQIIFGDELDWFFNDNGSEFVCCYSPLGALPNITPGQELIEIIFTYNGGETQLNWGSCEVYDENFDLIVLSLINGCVCDLPEVTFHVTTNGNELEGAEVSVGSDSITTNSSGIAIFNLPDGDYSYTATKDGFAEEEGTFTVAGEPQLIEVEMEPCWDLVLHLIDPNGTTITDSALVIVNNDTVWSITGSAAFCVTDLTINYEVYIEGYYPNIGEVTIWPIPGTIEIIMDPILYNVTFFVNCCGEPLESIPITYEGETVLTNVAGLAMLNMPAGFYSFEIGGVPITFTVPDAVYVPVDICSEITFHITCDGYSLEGVSVSVNNETLITNTNGIVVFCLQNGTYTYIISKPGYETVTGSFNVSNEPLLIEIDPCFPNPEVTLFVNCCGEPLEGIPVTIDGYTIITPVSGVVVLSLLPGSYSVAIGGYIFNFTVPGTTYIDADICSEVTFHVTDISGNDLEYLQIGINGEVLMTGVNGTAMICLETGSYNYWAFLSGLETQTGTIWVDTIPQTVEIVMPAQTWGVIINVIGFECDNEFEELIIICNGDTVSVGQPVYLENGSYNYEVAMLGCPSLVTGNFEVVNAPQTVQLILNDFPKAYIHVSWAGYPVSNVAVVLDNEDTLYTNGSGNAIFCVGGGNHIVHIPEYGFYEGEFTFNCFENIHYYYLGGIGINEISLENIFQLYPNPSSGKFYFEAKNTGSDPIEVQVMDLTGRIVYERQPAISEKFEIDLSGQPKGMYFVRVKSGEGLLTEKIVIQ